MRRCLDEDGRDEHDWRGKDEPDKGDEDVGQPFEDVQLGRDAERAHGDDGLVLDTHDGRVDQQQMLETRGQEDLLVLPQQQVVDGKPILIGQVVGDVHGVELVEMVANLLQVAAVHHMGETVP